MKPSRHKFAACSYSCNHDFLDKVMDQHRFVMIGVTLKKLSNRNVVLTHSPSPDDLYLISISLNLSTSTYLVG